MIVNVTHFRLGDRSHDSGDMTQRKDRYHANEALGIGMHTAIERIAVCMGKNFVRYQTHSQLGRI